MTDVAERELWDEYMAAYEDMIRQTSTPEAPWFVVPADQQMVHPLVVAAAMVQGDGPAEARLSQGRRRGAQGTAQGA